MVNSLNVKGKPWQLVSRLLMVSSFKNRKFSNHNNSPEGGGGWHNEIIYSSLSPKNNSQESLQVYCFNLKFKILKTIV